MARWDFAHLVKGCHQFNFQRLPSQGYIPRFFVESGVQQLSQSGFYD